MSLLAHCVGLSVNAVHGFERRPAAWAHAEQLASALNLDMADWWSPTAERYLARVTKAHTLAAVREAVSPEAAERLRSEKKDALVAAAEPQLVAARWLPRLLRTASPRPDAPDEGQDGAEAGVDPRYDEPAAQDLRELVAAE